MKPTLFKGSRAHLTAVLLAFTTCAALALEFAIQPHGYSRFGFQSSDGIFSVSGALEPVERVEMTGGDFRLSGAFRSAIADANLTVPEINLLPFGDAEGLENADGTTAIVPPGWTVEGYLIAARWGTPGGWPTLTDAGPPDRGQNFFSGGPDNGVTTATIHIDLPSSPARIDSGHVLAELSGWFGGFQGQNDMAILTATFLDPQDSQLRTVRVGGITADQRRGRTGLLRDSAIVTIPAGARRVKVVLEMRRSANNGFNDGYADNLRLVIRDPTPIPVSQTDLAANGSFEDLENSFVPDGVGLMSLAVPSAAIPGWTTTGAELVWAANANSLGFRSPYGAHFLDLTGLHDTPPYGGVQQSLTTMPGRRYRLSFALGTYQDFPAARGPVSIEAQVGAESRTFTFTPGGAGNQWQGFTMEFTSLSHATDLVFVGTASAGGAYLALDNVSVVELPGGEPTGPLSLDVPTISGPDMKLTFRSTAGRTYGIEARAGLDEGSWTPIPGLTATGTGERVALVLSNAFGLQRGFYRLRELP